MEVDRKETLRDQMNLKIMVRHLHCAKAAAAMDREGRVLVVLSDNLSRFGRAVYALWGLSRYVSFKIAWGSTLWS